MCSLCYRSEIGEQSLRKVNTPPVCFLRKERREVAIPTSPLFSTGTSITFLSPWPISQTATQHCLPRFPPVKWPFRLQVQCTHLLVLCFKSSQCQEGLYTFIFSCRCGVMKEESHSPHLAADVCSESEKLIDFVWVTQALTVSFFYYCRCLGFQGFCFYKIWNSTKQNVHHEKKLSLKNKTKPKTEAGRTFTIPKATFITN